MRCRLYLPDGYGLATRTQRRYVVVRGRQVVYRTDDRDRVRIKAGQLNGASAWDTHTRKQIWPEVDQPAGHRSRWKEGDR